MKRPAALPSYIALSHTSEHDITMCKHRMIFFSILFSFILGGVALKTVHIASTSNVDIALQGKTNAKDAGALVRRRELADRNGTALAVNVFTSSIHANPRAMPDKESAITRLSAALPDFESDTLRELVYKDRSYVWIKRHLTPKEAKAVNEAAVAGVYFKNDEKRAYPYKHLFSHVLGYVDVDGRGIAGSERYFNERLSRPTDNDNALRLSLDVGIQHAVRDVLERRMKEYNAKAASALVANVNTGELLAMVSLPDFDPNNPGQAAPEERFNIATSGVYEPGSVFKILNNALALEEQTISLHQKIDVSDPLRIGKFSIRDYHRIKEPINITEILMHSSNIGSAKIAQYITGAKQKAFFASLGLMRSTSVELPERAKPLPPSGWGSIYRATLSYGHGIAVTPLHVMQAASAMINGGIFYPATLIADPDGAAHGTRVISERTSKRIRRMLRLTAEFGTGKKADVPHYLVGGKTGTADKAKGGSYGDRRVVASFYAAFPMHAPKYALYVMFDEPVIKHRYIRASGGNTAAPAAGDMIERIAPMLDITPIDETDYTIRELFKYTKETASDGRA